MLKPCRVSLGRLSEHDISVYKTPSPGNQDPSGFFCPPLGPGSLAYIMKKDHRNQWAQAVIMRVIPQDLKKEGPSHFNRESDFYIVSTEEGPSHFNRESDFYIVSTERAVLAKNVVPSRYLAYSTISISFKITVGTRVLAKLFVGIVAEVPKSYNNHRYLVFFDSGRAEYFSLHELRVVCDSPARVWDLIPEATISDWVCHYLTHYPRLPMAKLTLGQTVVVEWEGKWKKSIVVKLDASLVCLRMPNGATEWLHRGSHRLASVNAYAAQTVHVNRPSKSLLRLRGFGAATNNKLGECLVELTPLEEEQPVVKEDQSGDQKTASSDDKSVKPRSQRRKRKLPKGTITMSSLQNAHQPREFRSHLCGPECVSWTECTPTSVLHYHHFLQPLMFGFQRRTKKKEIFYITPCGLTFRNHKLLLLYLLETHSIFTVDQFCFNPSVNVLRHFKESDAIIHIEDITGGLEKVGIGCVNELDSDVPIPLNYLTTWSYTFSYDDGFLICCDCLDNCQDVKNCSCQQLTLEGKAYNSQSEMLYNYRRLLQQVPLGVYECNFKCKCSMSCGNRVAQQPMSCQLQLFKTEKKGWGVRCLHDLPQGTFISSYKGNVLTESQGEEMGKKYGDQFLAEMDFIECAENFKEGYEPEVIEPNSDYWFSDADADHYNNNDEHDGRKKTSDSSDPDFKTNMKRLPAIPSSWESRLRKRKREDSINKEFPKVQPKISVRKLYGADEEVYLLDAQMQGNISRYFNHSCRPNMFVQNVFIETHDLRFPTVAFYAREDIKAGTELTWDYSYDVGMASRKVLCHCGSANCRGRLL